jgi:hypothetical protein
VSAPPRWCGKGIAGKDAYLKDETDISKLEDRISTDSEIKLVQIERLLVENI